MRRHRAGPHTGRAAPLYYHGRDDLVYEHCQQLDCYVHWACDQLNGPILACTSLLTYCVTT